MTCEWPVDRSCLPDLPDKEDESYAAQLALRTHSENTAIAVLWALSGRQFSCTELTVRPEPVGWKGMCDDAPLIEAYYRNDWRGITSPSPSPMTVRLAGPVYEITKVTIDGQDLDPSEYRAEGDILYRLGKRWPRNNMSRPMGFPGTWSVTYIQGRPPPSFVGRFVGELAAEMITACIDTKRCKLPRTVVSTSRSG